MPGLIRRPGSDKTIYQDQSADRGLSKNITGPTSRPGSDKTIYHDQSAGRVLTDQLCPDISFLEQLIGVGQEI